MAVLEASFVKFSKRPNSTKFPAPPFLGTVPVDINDGLTTITAPNIRVKNTRNGALLEANYVYIAHFKRYYYINDWRYNSDGTWTASCSVDVLSSWRPQIKSSGGYCNRAYSLTSNNGSPVPYHDETLVDDVYPARADFVEITSGLSSTPFRYEYDYGSFIMGVISTPRSTLVPEGTGTPTVGAVTYYWVAGSQMKNLVNRMTATSTSEWDDVNFIQGDIWSSYSNIMKTAYNPLQYVVSCKWFPFQVPNAVLTDEEPIWLGGWNSHAVGNRLTQTWMNIPNTAGTTPTPLYFNVVDVDEIYVPGQTYDKEDFPPVSPYAAYSIVTPWGTFDVDSGHMAVLMRAGSAVNRRIELTFTVDLISGNATMIARCKIDGMPVLTPSWNPELFRREIYLALDIPITQIVYDTLSDIETGVSLATRALNDIPAGVISGIKSMGTDTSRMGQAIRDTASDICKLINNTPTAQSTAGTITSFTPRIYDFLLIQTRYKTVGRAPTLYGRPVKKQVASLSDANGFVQMSYSDFNAPCTQAEKDRILAFLSDGIFLE